MAKKAVEPDFQWILPNGKPTQYFLELIRSISERSFTEPVSITVPTNGQVAKFVSATGKWTPGTDNT